MNGAQNWLRTSFAAVSRTGAQAKTTLDAAKAEGVKLGGPQLKQAQRRGVASNKANLHKDNNHHDRGNTEQFSTTRRKQRM